MSSYFQISNVYIVEKVEYDKAHVRRVWCVPEKKEKLLVEQLVEQLMIDVTNYGDYLPTFGDRIEVMLTNKIDSNIPEARRDFYLNRLEPALQYETRQQSVMLEDYDTMFTGKVFKGPNPLPPPPNPTPEELEEIKEAELFYAALSNNPLKDEEEKEKEKDKDNDKDKNEEKEKKPWVPTKQLWISAYGLLIWFSLSLGSTAFDKINIEGEKYHILLRKLLS
jgi:hypothetical protein